MVDTTIEVVSGDRCLWHVYAYDSSRIFGINFIAGLVSLALTSLLMLTLVRAPSKGWSHVMILNLTAVCWFRSILSVFVHVVVPTIYDGFTIESCAVIGYVHKLISAYQVEAVTLLSIERYVLAKYHKLGIQVQRGHYILFLFLCWIFASFYSLTPLLGFGTFLGSWGGEPVGDEALKSRALFTMECKTMLYKITHMALQLAQSVKPFVLTSYMLYWTRKIENECYNEDSKYHAVKAMTKTTLRVTTVSALLWMPTFLCYIWTISQANLMKCPDDPPAWLFMYGSLGFEIAPAATVLTIIATNEYFRRNVLNELIFFKKSIREKND